MRHLLASTLSAITLFATSSAAFAEGLNLTSSDISHGDFMPKAQEFIGFGCDGKDLSPQLSWSGAPEGTKSFALTMYDPDAPTGSGWWHWQIINIPTQVTQLPTGAGAADGKLAPKGSRQIENDYGVAGFGGACPPPGDGAHRYQFTLHALGVEKIDVPANASSALVGFMINANSLGSATLESLYKRD